MDLLIRPKNKHNKSTNKTKRTDSVAVDIMSMPGNDDLDFV